MNMNMILVRINFQYPAFPIVFYYFAADLDQPIREFSRKHWMSVFCNDNQMVLKFVDCVSVLMIFSGIVHNNVSFCIYYH